MLKDLPPTDVAWACPGMSKHSLWSFGRAEVSIPYDSSLGGLHPSVMENLCSCRHREDWGERKVLWFFGLFVSISRDTMCYMCSTIMALVCQGKVVSAEPFPAHSFSFLPSLVGAGWICQIKKQGTERWFFCLQLFLGVGFTSSNCTMYLTG